jgi:putative transposase
MKRTSQTTYRYRLDPTAEQAKLLFQFAGARRFIWNWALKRKLDYYQKTGKTLSLSDLCKELTILKQQPTTAWLRQIDSQSLQQALRDLENAFQHFFRRLRNGAKKKGFPKFKSRKTDTPRFRIPQQVVLEDARVSVPKIGSIKTIVHRPLEGVSKSATFKREACGHWYISLVVEQQIAPKADRTVERHVGIDVGLKTLAVRSDGERVKNPRWYQTQTRKLAHAQRALMRKQKGSGNRGKARVVVARLHQKIRNQRNDLLHKLSTDLVRHFDLKSIEDLNVRGLAKTKLSASVLDAGWGMFRSLLSYKAERQNSQLIAIGRFYPSSKICGVCGSVKADLTLTDREWTCCCGVLHDRDLNAARNIDREGLRLFGQTIAVGYTEMQNACGEPVRPIDRVGAGR